MSAYVYKKGFFIGRFQPFHIGHLYTVKAAHELCEHLIIGIGSTQESGTERNPFGLEARVEIINASLNGEGIEIERVTAMEVPDFNDDKEWLNYIMKRHPDIDVVFSDNPWVIGIFQNAGIRHETPLLSRDQISATRIRAMMRVEDPDWESLVPKGAHEVIKRNSAKVKGKSVQKS